MLYDTVDSQKGRLASGPNLTSRALEKQKVFLWLVPEGNHTLRHMLRLSWRKHTPCCALPMEATWQGTEHPAGTGSSTQLTARRKQGPWSYNHKETDRSSNPGPALSQGQRKTREGCGLSKATQWISDTDRRARVLDSSWQREESQRMVVF